MSFSQDENQPYFTNIAAKNYKLQLNRQINGRKTNHSATMATRFAQFKPSPYSLRQWLGSDFCTVQVTVSIAICFNFSNSFSDQRCSPLRATATDCPSIALADRARRDGHGYRGHLSNFGINHSPIRSYSY